MGRPRRTSLWDWTGIVVILALAAGSRLGYLLACSSNAEMAPMFQVQGHSALDSPLVRNLKEQNWFGGAAPLSANEETTAHVAPGYPWLVSLLARWELPVGTVVSWTQLVLGTLTAACYYFFARSAFQSSLVAFLAGLLVAIHPFWIFNTVEVADGVLVSFLLAFALFLGTRASQTGDALSSLLLGLVLAALAMTRAALLPFAVAVLLWFLLRCRSVRTGWFCALVAFLGFGNGLIPWAVRNLQEYGEPVPVVDSALLHVWMGNNPLATGSTLDEATLRKTISSERLEALLNEPNQATRYAALGKEIVQEVQNDPGATVGRRLWAGLMFLFGENWFKNNNLALLNPPVEDGAGAAWVRHTGESFLRVSLLAMLVIGFFGWRLSLPWRREARLAALALVLVPLPYLVSHAEFLSGPRLPLDGVLLCYVAYALARLVPHVKRDDPPLA